MDGRGGVGAPPRHVWPPRPDRAPASALGPPSCGPAEQRRGLRVGCRRSAVGQRAARIGDAPAAGVRSHRHARGASGRAARADTRQCSATSSSAAPRCTSSSGQRGTEADSSAPGPSSPEVTGPSPSRRTAISTRSSRCSRRRSASSSAPSTPIRARSCAACSTAMSPRIASMRRCATTPCASSRRRGRSACEFDTVVDRRSAGRRLAEHAAARRAARHLATGGCRIPRRRRVLRHARSPPGGHARRTAAAGTRAQPGDRPGRS